MAWTIEFIPAAQRQLRKLGRPTATQIVDYMEQRVAPLEDPRMAGKPLVGNLDTYWRYRVGDYRILCELQDSVLRILVVRVGHRRDVYR